MRRRSVLLPWDRRSELVVHRARGAAERLTSATLAGVLATDVAIELDGRVASEAETCLSRLAPCDPTRRSCSHGRTVDAPPPGRGPAASGVQTNLLKSAAKMYRTAVNPLAVKNRSPQGDLPMSIMTLTRQMAVAAVALASAFGATAADARSLVLYTASNSEIEKVVMDAFRAAHPDIDVSSVGMSTGPITEKALAEMDNPQADVVWMVNHFALNQLKDAGAFQPYEPKDNVIAEPFKDPDGFWIGHNGTIMAMAVNSKLLAEKNLPTPSDWVDLIKPVYKDQITVAAPTKSGTGFTIFSNMADMFGETFIENIDANIFQYNSSGSAAARQVGGGETTIGLSYDTAIMQQVAANPDVQMVIGRLSPNIIEGAGLVAGAPNEAEGKLFMDWLFSEAGMSVLEPHIGLGAAPGYGKIDLDKVWLWEMRRPVDPDAFKAEWAAKYEQ
jgi:iron(III) transport system substrate-binding protein